MHIEHWLNVARIRYYRGIGNHEVEKRKREMAFRPHIVARLGDFTPTTLAAMADDMAEAIDTTESVDRDYGRICRAYWQIVYHLQDSEGEEFVVDNIRCPEAVAF